MVDGKRLVSPVGQRQLDLLAERRAGETRLYVSTQEAMETFGIRATRLRTGINSGEFPVLRDGRSLRLFVPALFDYSEGRVIASNPPQGRVRSPAYVGRKTKKKGGITT
jgi:hypothetical protein